jgi:hypothetical protein
MKNVPHVNVQQSTYITQDNTENIPQVSSCHSNFVYPAILSVSVWCLFPVTPHVTKTLINLINP